MKLVRINTIYILLALLIVACQKEQPEEIQLTYGSLTDVDGNIYKTVKIGDSWWMCENLKVSHFNNGDILQLLSTNDTLNWQDTPSCKFVNDSLYGYLYNYLAVSDIRGLAPEGWHVATDNDWKALERAIGMDSLEVEQFSWRGTNEVNSILTNGSNNWPTNCAHFGSNKFGLAIQPGGIVQYQGLITANGSEAFFWTSNFSGPKAIYRSISSTRTQIFRQYADLRFGMSVRCVKN
jgi:uncharacterized protein (TIGR02145 family)